MKKILAMLAALALPACTDPYGRPDPGATALLGAAAGAAVGLGVAAAVSDNDRHRYRAWDGRYHYDRPYRRTYTGEPFAYRPRYYRRDPYYRW